LYTHRQTSKQTKSGKNFTSLAEVIIIKDMVGLGIGRRTRQNDTFPKVVPQSSLETFRVSSVVIVWC